MKDLIKKQCIGLTGGVATGKSTVAGMLRSLGYKVFDADLIARAVVAKGLPAYNDIVANFGRDILDSQEQIDRRKLAGLVFNDPEKRKSLEAFTHPRIRDEFLNLVSNARHEIGSEWFFYEAALLFEAGRHGEFHKILCTWCPRDIQIQRLMNRNGYSREEALAVMSSQMPADEKRDRSDLVIDTNCDMEELKIRLAALLQTATR